MNRLNYSHEIAINRKSGILRTAFCNFLCNWSNNIKFTRTNCRYLSHRVMLFYSPRFTYLVFATPHLTKVYHHLYYVWCSAVPSVWCLFCPSNWNYDFAITLIQPAKAFQVIVENKSILLYTINTCHSNEKLNWIYDTKI